MVEDAPLELLKLRAGLEPELVDQGSSRVLVDLERFCLPSGAVEGEHEQAARALAERLLAHELFELRHELAVAAELQVGVDPVLERAEAKLLQARDRALGERLVGELRERRPAPQRERLS